MKNYEQYININARKGLPRSYWFNQPIRWFTIAFALFAIVYAGWLIFTKIEADASTFTKVVPFIIIFFAVNSLLRNFLTLNRIYFSKDYLRLEYLLRKKVEIKWESIISIKLLSARQKLLTISYSDDKDEAKTQDLTMAFPKMLEILNAMLELCPQAELDDFMQGVIVADRETSSE